MRPAGIPSSAFAAVALLLKVSLLPSAAISALSHWWSGVLVGRDALLQVINVVVGFALTTGVLAMIFR